MEAADNIQKFVQILVAFINAVKALYNSIKGNEDASVPQENA